MKRTINLLYGPRGRLVFLPAIFVLLAYHSAFAQPELDFGDAPEQDSTYLYPVTLANKGACHQIDHATYLGAGVDAETDGQPGIDADQDDLTTSDDEDGVTFLDPLLTNTTVQVQVVASVDGYLNAWIDFNGNYQWRGGIEHVFCNTPLTAGTNILSVHIPFWATVSGPTYARFRFSSAQDLKPFGPRPMMAPDGEVEDYKINFDNGPDPELDFGDAPDQPYPTLLSNNGARHIIDENLYMGALLDAEADGQPNANASGDDNNNLDDEDGVVFIDSLIQGTRARVSVQIQGQGYLNGWIDFNSNGRWIGRIEHIVRDTLLATGTHVLRFKVPRFAQTGRSYARFRLSTRPHLRPFGPAPDGEVEDEAVEIFENSEIPDNGSGDNNRRNKKITLMNFPNPFNPTTEIRFSLPEQGHTGLVIYNLLGAHVKTLVDSELEAGAHQYTWNGTDGYGVKMASGSYFYRLEVETGSDRQVVIKRLTLLK